MNGEDFIDTSWKQIEQNDVFEWTSQSIEAYRSADGTDSSLCASPRADDIQQDEVRNLESLMSILSQLGRVDEATLDNEVKHGTATFLIRTLHNNMTNPGNVFRRQIGKARALRVSIICSALETSLRSSCAALPSFVETMPRETLPTLAVVVQIFTYHHRGSATVRDVTLHKTARILNYLCSHGTPIRIVVVEALFVLLKGTTDTRIDAAMALASLATRRQDALYPETIERIGRNSRPLISILATAALSLPDEQVVDALDALLHLATSSETVLVNVTRRSSALRALGQCMKSSTPEIRRNAFIIAKILLSSESGFTELFAVEPSNGTILLKGLATALNECEAELQHFATSIMTKTFANMNGNLDHIGAIIETLVTVSSTAIQDRTSHQAALALCIKAPALEGTCYEAAICAAIAELVLSSSTFIRSQALSTLGKLCSRTAASHAVARQETFHRAMISIISQGGEEEVSAAVAVLLLLAQERQNRNAIRRSSELLDAVVDMTTQHRVERRSDYMACAEMVLLLLADDADLDCFVHYTELLPWLAALANSNTSSKELKADTVSTIVRLISHLLQTERGEIAQT